MSTTSEIFMSKERPWRSRLDPRFVALFHEARAALEPKSKEEPKIPGPGEADAQTAARFERKTVEDVGSEALSAAQVPPPPEADS